LAREKNKTRLLQLYASMFLAIVLGVYAQDIAYFLHNNLTIPLLLGLTLATILSILLFLIPPILLSKLCKVGKKEIKIYLGINTLIGVVISLFSLIVLAAWWG